MKKLKSFFVMALIATFVSCGTTSRGDDDKDNPGGDNGGSTSQTGGNVKPEGTVITLRVKYSGSQTSKDVRVQVVKPYGKDYYIASTWNSYYVRVRKIANGTTYNGL
ncbi:MAG: hypothetical protein ACI304_03815 [Lepagella sp.]